MEKHRWCSESPPAGPCRFCSLTGVGDRWRQGRDSAYLLEEWSSCASMERSMGPVSVWVGREGRGLQGQWAGRWLTVIGHGEGWGSE